MLYILYSRGSIEIFWGVSFLRTTKQSLLTLTIIVDIIAIALSWFLAYFLRFYILPGGSGDLLRLFSELAILVIAFFLLFLNRNRLYELSIEKAWKRESIQIIKSSFQVFLLLAVVLYYFFPSRVSRLTIAIFFIIVTIALTIGRTYIFSKIKKGYAANLFLTRTLLVGYGKNVEEYEKAISSSIMSGISIIGQYDNGSFILKGCPTIKADSLHEAVNRTHADHIVIGYPLEDYEKEKNMLNQGLELPNQRVELLPWLPKSYIGNKVFDYKMTPILQLNAAELGFMSRIIKRAFDIVSCSVGIILLSPLFIIIALLVKLSSPGPILFKQKRVTRDGKIFVMYKFRSMRTDMPEGKVHWTVENDPRVTKIGAFLRSTSLDELPQFFNVLGGSMSLIGPRPERPELVEKFNKEIPGYRMRHRHKAGISGWAQVNGYRGNTSLERRIEYDLFYIQNWSFVLDMKIVLFTFFRGFVNENAY